MNKRHLHHIWTRLRIIKGQYFLIAAILALIAGIMGLRQNNIKALSLRDEVYKVDEQNGDVEAALKKLREHVYSHMNSNLSGGTNTVAQPVQLKFRYERLLATEKARVSSINEKIYNDAQADCEKRFPEGLSGRGRVPCIEEYVSSRSIKEQPIEDSLYKFDFVSPLWSADLAGLSLLLSVVSFAMFIILRAVEYWVKIKLSSHL